MADYSTNGPWLGHDNGDGSYSPYVYAKGAPAPSPTAQLTVAAINFASSGDNTVIAAGTGTQTIKVYRMYFSVAGATAILFKDGVVTDAALSFTNNGGMVLDYTGEPWFVGAAATAFKINSSNAVQVSGRIYYIVS